MSTTKPQKPIIYIDASSLKESSCQRRLLYTIFYGFTNRTRHQNFQAGYGSAFHKALEFWYSSKSANYNVGLFGKTRAPEVQKQAIEMAVKYYEPYTPYISQREYEFRTPTHLTKSLEHYFKSYNPDAETLRPIKGIITPGLLESKFIYPAVWFDERLFSEHFELIISGTVDGIFSLNGQECFVDHKSTSFKFGEKDKFFADFDLSIQMQLYTLIVERLIKQRLPFIINGIFLKKPTQAAEKKGEFDGCNLERSPLKTYTDGQMKEFEVWLRDKLVDLKLWLEHYYENTFKEPHTVTTPNFSACHPKFPCPYFGVCSQEPELQGRILGVTTKEQYNPLHFSD